MPSGVRFSIFCVNAVGMVIWKGQHINKEVIDTRKQKRNRGYGENKQLAASTNKQHENETLSPQTNSRKTRKTMNKTEVGLLLLFLSSSSHMFNVRLDKY